MKDEIAVGGSPRGLAVLPVIGSQTLKSVPAGTGFKDYVADIQEGCLKDPQLD